MKARQFSGRWFRVYDESADDPKLQMLSDRLHRFLFNCWCIASKHGGYLPPISEIAWRVRKTIEQTTAMIAELSERGLLDEAGTTFEPHNWQQRQFQSDVSTDRVKAFRKRQRNGNETFQKQPETVTETVPEQNRTEQNRNRDEQADFSVSDWSEARYARHPKVGHKMAALHALSELSGLSDPKWRERFERVHEAWMTTETWKWKNGARAPYFDEFVRDEWFLREPAEIEEEDEALVILRKRRAANGQ